VQFLQCAMGVAVPLDDDRVRSLVVAPPYFMPAIDCIFCEQSSNVCRVRRNHANNETRIWFGFLVTLVTPW